MKADRPSVIGRLEPGLGRLAPDLQEMDLFGAMSMLAVPDPSPSRRHLNITALENFCVSKRVITTRNIHSARSRSFPERNHTDC